MNAQMAPVADPRLILREDELDAGLELLLLAEASVWATVDAALAAEGLGLGRSHWRAAFLLRRRPGVGVQELAHLTSLSKQAASRILVDLAGKGLIAKSAGDLDGRRRSAALTDKGVAFEAAVTERLRAQVGRAYRGGGLEGVAGARRILAALAGGRTRNPQGSGPAGGGAS
jgi:DNA-binding MarR family transcriptional regulator